MPKSRNRKDHKKKSKHRTIIEKNKRAKAERELMELIRKSQMMPAAEKNENNNIVGIEDLGNIVDIDDELKSD